MVTLWVVCIIPLSGPCVEGHFFLGIVILGSLGPCLELLRDPDLGLVPFVVDLLVIFVCLCMFRQEISILGYVSGASGLGVWFPVSASDVV